MERSSKIQATRSAAELIGLDAVGTWNTFEILIRIRVSTMSFLMARVVLDKSSHDRRLLQLITGRISDVRAVDWIERSDPTFRRKENQMQGGPSIQPLVYFSQHTVLDELLKRNSEAQKGQTVFVRVMR